MSVVLRAVVLVLCVTWSVHAEVYDDDRVNEPKTKETIRTRGHPHFKARAAVSRLAWLLAALTHMLEGT
jgi:hypothetical protein